MGKYKALLKNENIKENKIAEFESKIKFSRHIWRKHKNKKNKKSENNSLNSEKELNYISLEKINNYLELIKNINGENLIKI